MLTIVIHDEFDDEKDLVDALRYISELIDDGYTSGYSPNWDIADDGEEE
jgi:hypothetical protein